MMDRRTFTSLLATAAVAPRSSFAQGAPRKSALYSSVGPVLTHYDVDVEAAALIQHASVTLPANVQYAWPHASRRYLYVASSSSAPGTGPAGTEHHVSAFRIDPASGALTPHGNPIRLPSALRVYRIKGDATLGEEVPQRAPIDAGIYGHQVRVTANNRLAIFVARGNDPAGGKPEDPGALKVFSYKDGLLTNGVSIAPNGGYGFGPRHLDFHPTRPWVYVSLERENKLDMFRLDGDTLAAAPAFRRETLAEPNNIKSRQAAGTVHVHPNGRFVYGVNRADTTTEFEGRKLFVGGENTLAVYSIDPSTGEPAPIQHVDTRGIHCRTFHIDASGRMLVAAHIMGLAVRDGAAVREVPACMSVFRIGADGRLDYMRKYDIDTGGKLMFWMGMVKL